jgi:hypothetical protein
LAAIGNNKLILIPWFFLCASACREDEVTEQFSFSKGMALSCNYFKSLDCYDITQSIKEER